jgi:hypothetical protein
VLGVTEQFRCHAGRTSGVHPNLLFPLVVAVPVDHLVDELLSAIKASVGAAEHAQVTLALLFSAFKQILCFAVSHSWSTSAE